MLCPRCAARGEYDAAAAPDAAAPVNRLRLVVCGSCGGPMNADPTPNLLNKLVQLAQFGLTAGVGPLLEPSAAPSPARDAD